MIENRIELLVESCILFKKASFVPVHQMLKQQKQEAYVEEYLDRSRYVPSFAQRRSTLDFLSNHFFEQPLRSRFPISHIQQVSLLEIVLLQFPCDCAFDFSRQNCQTFILSCVLLIFERIFNNKIVGVAIKTRKKRHHIKNYNCTSF